MRKTYIANMPTHIGAFLQASRCFTELGINISRASYNKAIDSHTLFIEVEGTPEQLAMADERLHACGYLDNDRKDSRIVLLEFRVKNETGSAIPVLELVHRFQFNISYVSAQETQSEYQLLKLGLYVDNETRFNEFLEQARRLCSLYVVEYDPSERYFDNSIFYSSFLQGILRNASLNDEEKNRLLIYTNLAMQMLDDLGTFPHQTFDSIGRFTQLLHEGKAQGFIPRITRHCVGDSTTVTLIEPPCGSNTAIIQSQGRTLFIDTGHACYRDEMLQLLRRELPEFEQMEKTVLITHPDLDHCGLLPLFDRILVTQKTADSLLAEYRGEKTFRERIDLHEPYIHICKLLTGYAPPRPETLEVLWGDEESVEVPLKQIGFFDFGELHFEVYEGQGGHVPGETVLIEQNHHIAFTGDIYVNVKDQIPHQALFNRYSPILMTSVDSDAEVCAMTRRAVLQKLGPGQWRIFGGHGNVIHYEKKAK